MSYSYTTLVEPRGHALWIDIDKPTNGLSVEFNHTNTGIEHITPLDFLTNPGTPLIRRSQPGAAAPISISTDGWVHPKSGVAFTWTLTSELTSR
ncbi:hypothetical protein [Amycolatopsis samaneae]|uniref:Uncharacterized protein n=1 Tax=Amycolatopsis samaneae TaxID=664691 RepID=A0ABW5GP30_9PSEU